ncbi:hypothetical protein KIN20_009379 [Parelaphostrongylus tenuis]|uniref:Rhodanese domain-containing protein n=1 Tax=Parelaphostrongylus tenuis TaxID=148309 RepID=A0AAD5QKM9_PARTN|nr:hypothetical protein KIN20_009379 [Parelaphostrongylus tenuis]
MLGVNDGDHVVVYSRGPAAGMLWAARAWWTFKVYGHEKVSVLDGGIDAYKKAGHPVTNDVVVAKPGNWSAKTIDFSRFITFDELEKKNADGSAIFDDLRKINYLDARPSPVFKGDVPLGIPAEGATGSHLKHAKNVPFTVVVTDNGLKSREEIVAAMKSAGFDEQLPTVTACNGGGHASLLALALSHAGKQCKVFNGSLIEIGQRAPHYISEK